MGHAFCDFALLRIHDSKRCSACGACSVMVSQCPNTVAVIAPNGCRANDLGAKRILMSPSTSSVVSDTGTSIGSK